MEKRKGMKKRNLAILIISALIVISLMFILYPKFTGLTGNVINSEKFTCSDSDGGKSFSVKGVVKQGDVVKGTDICTSETRLKEYYCLSETSTNVYYYECPYKCVEGACVEKTSEINQNSDMETSTELNPLEKTENPIESEPVKETGLAESNFFQGFVNWFKDLFKR